MGVKADIQRLGSIVIQIKPGMTNDAVILAKTHHHHRQIIVHGNRLSSYEETNLIFKISNFEYGSVFGCLQEQFRQSF